MAGEQREGERQLQVAIKTINNEVHNLVVDTNSSVSSLKTLVQELTSIESDRQRLIYRGRVLSDTGIVADYNIENGHTIHMVAKPANYRELQQNAAASSSAVPQQAHRPSGPAVAATLTGAGAADPGNAFRRAIFESLGRAPSGGAPASMTSAAQPSAEVTRANILESNLENIRQGMLTVNTMLSMNPSYQQQHRREPSTESTNVPDRQFYAGQWIDVKDTVQQWLEATVMTVDQNRRLIFVHYNGWYRFHPQPDCFF